MSKALCATLSALILLLSAQNSEAAHVTGFTVTGVTSTGTTQYATAVITVAKDFPTEDWGGSNCCWSSVYVWIDGAPQYGTLCAASSSGCSSSLQGIVALAETSVTIQIGAYGDSPTSAFATTLTAHAGNSNYPTAPIDPGMTASVTVQPGITGPTTVWWLGGVASTNFPTSIALSAANGPSTTWTWGSGFSFDCISFVSTAGTQTTIRAKGTAVSGVSNDVIVRATNSVGGYADYHVTVKTPQRLVAGSVTTNPDAKWGYVTSLNYSIVDQFGSLLPPGAMPVNEQWTTAMIKDIASSNWSFSTQQSVNTSTSAFNDVVEGEAKTKTPLRVFDPLSAQAVVHWGQAWQVGSSTTGLGKRVQTDTIQKYLGRAAHLDIVSPIP